MKRTEMYKALEGKKLYVCEIVALLKWAFFIREEWNFQSPLLNPSSAQIPLVLPILQKGDYIEDLGKCILVRRGLHDYMFLFRA